MTHADQPINPSKTTTVRLGESPVLASDPHDGSLWVGGVGALGFTDARGQSQRTVKPRSGEAVEALVASQDGGAYFVAQSRLLRFSEAGRIHFQRKMPSGGVSSPLRLPVDEMRGSVPTWPSRRRPLKLIPTARPARRAENSGVALE